MELEERTGKMYERIIDSKWRIYIPAEILKEYPNSKETYFFLMNVGLPEPTHLALFTSTNLGKIIEPIKSNLELLRLNAGRAEYVPLDKQNRIVIPGNFRDCIDKGCSVNMKAFSYHIKIVPSRK